MYKNTLLATKGGCICTPLTPPKSATADPPTSGPPLYNGHWLWHQLKLL